MNRGPENMRANSLWRCDAAVSQGIFQHGAGASANCSSVFVALRRDM